MIKKQVRLLPSAFKALAVGVLAFGGCMAPANPPRAASETPEPTTRPIRWGKVDRLPRNEPWMTLRPGKSDYHLDPGLPAYLMVRYAVDRRLVVERDAREDMRRSLTQVREWGPGAFPERVVHVVVIVMNLRGRGDPAERPAFGAVFPAAAVFDPAADLARLTAEAELDPRPFTASTTVNQDWPVDERHAQKNSPK